MIICMRDAFVKKFLNFSNKISADVRVIYSLTSALLWHKKATVFSGFFMFARHGRTLTGESPEHAQIVGSV